MFELRNVRVGDILTVPHLQIPPRQITCIVGRSGSGKTTLLKLLNRMITPDAGDILFQGQPITGIDPIALRRRVIMLPQTPVMFDGTVRDNLLVGLGFSEHPMIDDDALRRILEVVDLRKSLDNAASTLSGGEKQRVALGRGLAMQPNVALLDEPSSALDRGSERVVIQQVIAAARDRGVTIIMVTHSVALAEAVADHVIEVDAGRIVAPAGI
jgi:putative ABC transport system ATP-binding protein